MNFFADFIDCSIYECVSMVKISSHSDKVFPIGNGVENPTPPFLTPTDLGVFYGSLNIAKR